MKRLLHIGFIACLWICCTCMVRAGLYKPFSLKAKATTIKVIPINQTITHSTQLEPFAGKERISGLSVVVTIRQYSIKSLVRILLEDETGKNYLVLESNRMRNDVDKFTLSDYAEETLLLNNVCPKRLKVLLKDASIELKELRYAPADAKTSSTYSPKAIADARRLQVEHIVSRINAYNRAHNKLWVAGVTRLSLKDYETRKCVLSLPDDTCETFGLEYYADGIIELGYIEKKDANEQSPYIDHFDWRNRHGKNWMTPVKDQGGSSYCVGFAIASAIESIFNLYYNNLLNLDVSEQDLMVYCPYGMNVSDRYTKGQFVGSVLLYAKEFGVADESSIPFEDRDTQGNVGPRPKSIDTVKIKDYKKVSDVNQEHWEDSIKHYLIAKGPLVSSYTRQKYKEKDGKKTEYKGHSLSLVGYRVAKVGDSVKYSADIYEGTKIIEEGNPAVGHTCWIFKDSYVKDEIGRKDGYLSVIIAEPDRTSHYYIIPPIYSNTHDSTDIRCVDEDGDGLYNWGIGPKPKTAPKWVPDTPDGDDSNYALGEMDQYGYIKPLNPDLRDTIYIRSNTVWNQPQYIHNHIVVESGAELLVNDTITCYKGVSLVLKKGGSLTLQKKDQAYPKQQPTMQGPTSISTCGYLKGVNLKASPGSSILIKDGAQILLRDEYPLSIPIGCELTIESGIIK